MAVPQKNTSIQVSLSDSNTGKNYIAKVATNGPEQGKIVALVEQIDALNAVPLDHKTSSTAYNTNKANWDGQINAMLSANATGEPNAATSVSGLADSKLYDLQYNDLNASAGTVGAVSPELEAFSNLTGDPLTNLPQPPATKGKIYVFPKDLGVGKNKKDKPQDYVRIGALKYKPSTPGLLGNSDFNPIQFFPSIIKTGLGSYNSSVPKDLNFEGEVILPMPLEVTDGTRTEWGVSKMDVMGAAMVAAAAGAADVPLAGDLATLMVALGPGRETAAAALLGAYGTGALAAKATGSPDAANAFRANVIADTIARVTNTSASPADILTKSTGKAVNPNSELLFRAPSLRSFNLQWKLIPRSEDEASTIRKIIRFFKVNMLPYIPKGGAILLQSPNVFVIRYETSNGSLNKSLPKPKLCALGEVIVNHTPDGTGWAAYKDSHPVATQISMSFLELTPLLGNDYSNISEDDVGL
ncbi:MAG: hypothetical protein ACO25L_01290 [Candidatus Nanopelagicales bacterium]|nr:baseplate tail tube cap [Synechococcus phage DSL-LC03]